jgi:hypothetical protein
MFRTAITLACATALAVAAPASAHPTAGRSCGLFTDRDGARIGAVVLHGGTTCSTTKRVLRAYIDSNAPCDGSACVRRHFGWTCAAAAAYAFPRLASCTRRTARIAAYSTAD